MTRDSENADIESLEYKTYCELMINGKIGTQVLVLTTVLSGRINVRDSSVGHIVLDTFDSTELITNVNQGYIAKCGVINLYIRNYSKKDIKNFIINDIERIVTRLITDVEEKNKTEFYNELHKQYKINVGEIFYLTDDKKIFLYNYFAIYKLVNRLISFLEMMTTIKKENYYIKNKYFEEDMRHNISKVFNYCRKNNGVYSKYWIDKILRILSFKNLSKN